jgi:hypothetical protein
MPPSSFVEIDGDLRPHTNSRISEYANTIALQRESVANNDEAGLD